MASADAAITPSRLTIGKVAAPAGLHSISMRLQDLPSVDELMRGLDDPLAVAAARDVLERAREEIRAGSEPGDLHSRLEDALAAARRPVLRRLLNATGVLVHTNLGRAPLAGPALERVAAVSGYSNLEYDLSSGPAARARITLRRCCAGSPAPRPRSSSTTTRPRCCSRSPRSPRAARSSSRAAS